jgi:hypothetical protein
MRDIATIFLSFVFGMACAACVAQDVVTGPLDGLGDRIEARIDKLADRFDTPIKELEEETLMGFSRLGAAIQAMQEDNKAARSERSSLMQRMREMAAEREGMLARIAEARDEIRQAREEWRPLQNLVDRIVGLVWKLIYLVVLLCVLAALVLLAVGYGWSKIKGLAIK